MVAMFSNLAPRLTDKIMEKTMFRMQQSDQPEQAPQDNGLYRPGAGLKERGGRAPYVSESSVYTQASLHPLLTGAVMAFFWLTLASVLRGQPRRWSE
jgi:hypothetical protein